MTKRVLSLLLTLAMVLSLCVPALAADDAFVDEAPAEVVEAAPEAPVEPEAPEAEEPVYEEPVVDEPAIEEPEVAAVAVDEPATIAVTWPTPEAEEAFRRAYDAVAPYMDGLFPKTGAPEYRIVENGSANEEALKGDLKYWFGLATKYLEVLNSRDDQTTTEFGPNEIDEVTGWLNYYAPAKNMKADPGKITDRPDADAVRVLTDIQVSQILSTSTDGNLTDTDTYEPLRGLDDVALKAAIKKNEIADYVKKNTVGELSSYAKLDDFDDTAFTVEAMRPGFWAGLQDVASQILEAKELVDTNGAKANHLTIKRLAEITELRNKWLYYGANATEFKNGNYANIYDAQDLIGAKANADWMHEYLKNAGTGYSKTSIKAFNTLYDIIFTNSGDLYSKVVNSDGTLKSGALYRDFAAAMKAIDILLDESGNSILKPDVVDAMIVNGVVSFDLTKFDLTFRKNVNDDNTYAFTYEVDGTPWRDAVANAPSDTYETHYQVLKFADGVHDTGIALPLNSVGQQSNGAPAAFKQFQNVHVSLYIVELDKNGKITYVDPDPVDVKDYNVSSEEYSGPKFLVDAEGKQAVKWNEVTTDLDNILTVQLDKDSTATGTKYDQIKFRLYTSDGKRYDTGAISTWTSGRDIGYELCNGLTDVDDTTKTGLKISQIIKAGNLDVELWVHNVAIGTTTKPDFFPRDNVTVEIPSIEQWGQDYADEHGGDEDYKPVGFQALLADLDVAYGMFGDEYVSSKTGMTTDTAKMNLQNAIDKVHAYLDVAWSKAWTNAEQGVVESLRKALADAKANLVKLADLGPLYYLLGEAYNLIDTDYEAKAYEQLMKDVEALETWIADHEQKGDLKVGTKTVVYPVGVTADDENAEDMEIVIDNADVLSKYNDMKAKIEDMANKTVDVKADRETLRIIIGEAWPMLEDDTLTVASRDALHAVLDEAEYMLSPDFPHAPLQSELYGMIGALVDAINSLEELGDKTELKAAIAKAEALKEDDYTADTWAAVEKALADAKAVDEDEDAGEKAVAEALEALNAAIAACEAEALHDAKQDLATQYGKAQVEQVRQHTQEYLDDVAAALKAADAVIPDSVTDIEAVKEATAALKALVEGAAADTAKQQAIELHDAKQDLATQYGKAQIEQVRDHTQEYLDAVAAALKAADAVIPDSVTDIEAVKEATAALKALVEGAAADTAKKAADDLAAAKAELQTAVDGAKVQQAAYTTEALDAAITAAEAALAAEDATVATLTAAKTTLDDAVKAANEAQVEYEGELSAAQTKLAAAVEKVAGEAEKKHTAEFKADLEKALAAAETAKTSKVVADVTAAAEALEALAAKAADDTAEQEAADALAAAKKALEADVTAAKAEAEKNHTDDFKTELDAAVKAAEAAAAATDIADVTKASDGLKAVMAKAADDIKAKEAADALAAAKAALTKAIADAKAAATKSYTDASKKAYDEALAAAEKALAAADATVATLSAAQTALETAVKGLTELPAAPKSGTGWAQAADGQWYYYNANKLVRNAWQWSCGEWYYMGADGLMYTGFQQVEGKWYMFETSNANQRQGMLLGGWQSTPYGAGYFVNQHNGRFGECTYTDQLGSFVNGHFANGDPVAA